MTRLILLALLLASPALAADAPTWKAGFAAVVITPTKPMWMSGYAARTKPAEGTEIVYLRRRFVPGPEAFDMSGTHTVISGDRLDNMAASLLGDPEMFWRLCDANRAVQPAELEVVHRVLDVPLPPGIAAPKGNS